MPKKQSNKIDLIAKFLDKEKVINFDNLSDIEEILNLSSSSFKFLTDSDADLFLDLFKISTIGQFASLDPEEAFQSLYTDTKTRDKIEHLLQTDYELEEKLKKAVTISKIIDKVREESLSFIYKEQKIIVVGLSNAGKTTILKKFGGQIGIKDLAKLNPTKGIERQEIVTSDLALAIWDFGGQEEYRNKYLQNPDKYFLNVDLVIYVIDLQDPGSFEESINYFNQIIDVLYKVEEAPYILIFIHKYDPDIKDESEVLLNIELLKDLIKGVFKERDEFEYDIFLSSIYSVIANEPKFSKYLKTTMQKTATLTDHKLEGMASILESTLNGIIRLSESVMAQYNNLDHRIRALETGGDLTEDQIKQIPAPEYSTQFKLTTDVPVTQSQKFEQRISQRKNVKSAILEELKDLFDKSKRRQYQS
ncbi:MAG: ADP-ribosylation factor-like protein [Candidatus Thorarchaeota archaeon]